MFNKKLGIFSRNESINISKIYDGDFDTPYWTLTVIGADLLPKIFLREKELVEQQDERFFLCSCIGIIILLVRCERYAHSAPLNN